MKAHYMSIFLILSLVGADSFSEDKNRRILHQPLYPATSSPPPPEYEIPQPSPPPPATPDSLNPDQPFFHELPNGPTDPTQKQGPQTRPAPAGGSSAANSTAAQQSKPIKKLAIAISSTIATLGIVILLAFYLFKRRSRKQDESQKLFGGSHRNTEDSTMPPSNFLYIGTVEPSARTLVNENDGANDSPYRKLNSGKRSDRYRPSPELQPMPPLRKPPPPPSMNSPPPMTSSDDESSDTNFYTPQGSSLSNESFGSRHGYLNNVISQVNQNRQENGSLPRSKRSSRKSRLKASNIDTKPVIIPSIKQSFVPTRPKFSEPPPAPDMARLQSISRDDHDIRKTPNAPPPPAPPPPPPLPLPVKSSKPGAVEAHNSLSIPKQMKSDSPKGTPRTEKESPTKNGVMSSSEKADIEENDSSKPKLKPLHWDKVRTNADQATVWDQIKSSSFQLNEDAMETLFGCNSVNSVPKEATRTRSLPSLERENRVLDPKKSQNIAILLRALNVTTEEVTEALSDGNPEGLGPELLETLVKMAPTKEEEIKLKNYDGEISKLGSAERFLKAILDVPFAFRRVESMLYRANFDTEVKYLRKSFQALEEASEELKNSRLFLKLLEAVLRTGNRMNDGTNRGDAKAFKLDTLLKLVDIKGTDGQTTLLHFVVQEIIRSEGTGSNTESENVPNTNFKFKEEEFKKQGLQVVSGLSIELCNVKKAAGMDSDVLSGYVSKLEMGLEKLRLVLQHEKQTTQENFFVSMKQFLNEATEEISKVKAEEKKALSHVKEATQYFHGDAAKEEAHPFRIFMIVRDFLSVLDNVCKDVGKMQDKATMGAGKSFRMPVTVSMPVLNRYNVRHDSSSDGDSM